MEPAALIILAIFVGTMLVVLSEKVNETATALFAMCLAAMVLLITMGIKFADFVLLIEWDTILFIAAMMIVVSVAGSSGMFQYIALLLVRRTGNNPKKVFIVFMAFVAIISLFFDPLPTMLIMGSFTVEICRALEMDAKPFLISEVIVANVASFPSVVGSVPNLVISAWMNIDAGQLLIVIGPLSAILFAVTIPMLLRIYKDSFEDEKVLDSNILFMIQPSIMIRSRRDFYISVVALGILVGGFIAGPGMNISPSFVALMVASGTLVLSQVGVEDLLRKLSWDTVFFIIGLFGIVASMTASGLIAAIVDVTQSVIGGNVFAAILFMLWVPGLVLALVDNIPVAALLTPLAEGFVEISGVVSLSLIVGANVGGYIIPFGDAPNMIAIGLSAEAGDPISIIEFTKVCLIIGTIHLIIASLYCFLWVPLI